MTKIFMYKNKNKYIWLKTDFLNFGLPVKGICRMQNNAAETLKDI